MNDQLRVVTWRAVSTEDQAERESLRHQAEINQQHVSRIGGIVVADLHVDGESRNIDFWEDACKALEAFRELDGLLRKKPAPFDIFMCYDLSRVARTDSLAVEFAKKCERASVRIYECMSPPSSLDGPISTPESRLMMLIKAHQNDQEVRKFAERSYFGRRARVKKGKHPGNPPFGYKRLYDELGISYSVIDEENAQVVRLFYDLFLNHGKSLLAICEELNARGFVSPLSKNPWVPGTLRQMLKNRWVYAGYTTWGSTPTSKIPLADVFRVKAEWAPLITEEMAREAEQQLASRVQAPRSVSSPYRFSMVARCDYCGAIAIARERAGRHRSATNRYACGRRCRNARASEAEMTEAIRDVIMSLQDPEVFESYMEDTPDHLAILRQNRDDTAKAFDAVKAERKRLTIAFTRESISIDEYDEIMAELQQRMESLGVSLAQLEDAIASTPTAESRRARLEEIRDYGIAMLDHPDNRTVNSWLRNHFTLFIRDKKICSCEIL